MSSSGPGAISDKDRLLFGAGFVFGVLCTLLIMMVVVATVTGEGAQEFVSRDIFATLVAGICFLAIVGVAMYGLAFPENRLKIPSGDLFRAVGTEEGSEPGGEGSSVTADDAAADDEKQ